MPATHVLVQHDDGRWYVAELLHQYRTDGRWPAVVTYSTGPCETYMRGKWADDLRRLVEMPPPGTGSSRSARTGLRARRLIESDNGTLSATYRGGKQRCVA